MNANVAIVPEASRVEAPATTQLFAHIDGSGRVKKMDAGVSERAGIST
jgi:hypothetical protein